MGASETAATAKPEQMSPRLQGEFTDLIDRPDLVDVAIGTPSQKEQSVPKLKMLTPQNSAIALIDYQPAMYQGVQSHDRLVSDRG